ncbi:translation machinery-associated protein 16, partial [Pisolithus orientalis]|uniref:translation machinery-associated protein 16 n=1 Tax=Pisolithus orientalis TaxID=936130 RepID=UPI0022246A23
APSKSTKKAKVFHPDSRKAAQLARTQLRKNKLSDARSEKKKKLAAEGSPMCVGFFYHALPPEGVLSLQELHSLVRDVWLTRHDHELEEERSARRKGRPKSTKEVKLEEIKLRESEEYRTGFEVLDLTHSANVELFRKWDQTEAAYVQMLRFIRITSTDPAVAILVQAREAPLPTADEPQ